MILPHSKRTVGRADDVQYRTHVWNLFSSGIDGPDSVINAHPCSTSSQYERLFKLPVHSDPGHPSKEKSDLPEKRHEVNLGPGWRRDGAGRNADAFQKIERRITLAVLGVQKGCWQSARECGKTFRP
jgi:hypothetical protein